MGIDRECRGVVVEFQTLRLEIWWGRIVYKEIVRSLIDIFRYYRRSQSPINSKYLHKYLVQYLDDGVG